MMSTMRGKDEGGRMRDERGWAPVMCTVILLNYNGLWGLAGRNVQLAMINVQWKEGIVLVH